MLEITRTAGQGIKIGTDHSLFVQEVGTNMAVCRLYCSIYDVLHPIVREKGPLTFYIGDAAIKVHCIRANRGQVRLGFEAPREIFINRVERIPK